MTMLIRVKYIDDRFDMVRPEILNRLLDMGSVQEFKRVDGWVRVDSSKMRHSNRVTYSGPERRRMLSH